MPDNARKLDAETYGKEVHRNATYIANGIFGDIKTKRTVRRILIKMIIQGIEISKNNPEYLTELKSMVKYLD